jgi:hypothetical protein
LLRFGIAPTVRERTFARMPTHKNPWSRTLKRGHRGQDVEAFQRGLNTRLPHIPARMRGYQNKIEVDGEFGPATLRAWQIVRNAIGLPRWLRPTTRAQQNVIFPDTRSARAKRLAKTRRKPPKLPLRELAYQQAQALIGVMEQGGNNTGPMVTRIIRTNGGMGPEPWCGDFVAYCYRLAGSKAVTRSWAAVRLLFGVAGIHRTTSPERGDLVRFTFDHVGLFGRDLGNGMIETIEGNTGSSGAVSDSSTGGDGVYVKHRSKSLVNDYLRVTR